MFDIGFIELLVVGVVALLVIGPERLPKAARTAGQWIGRLNRYVAQVKQDIDRDMRLEELRKMQQEMQASIQKYELMANETAQQVEDTVAKETGELRKVMQAMSVTDGGLTMQEYEDTLAQQAESPDATRRAQPSVTTPPNPVLPGVAPAVPAPLPDAPAAARGGASPATEVAAGPASPPPAPVGPSPAAAQPGDVPAVASPRN